MKKLYAVVINTIDHSCQGVQAGHAVGKLAAMHPEIDWDNQTFVYLQSGEKKLYKLIDRLIKNGLNVSTFNEPDIGDKLTAMACITDDYEQFKSFSLF